MNIILGDVIFFFAWQNCFVFTSNYQWCALSYHYKDEKCLYWMYSDRFDKGQDCFEHNSMRKKNSVDLFGYLLVLDLFMFNNKFLCSFRLPLFQLFVKKSLRLNQLKWHILMGSHLYILIYPSTIWKFLYHILMVPLESPWTQKRYAISHFICVLRCILAIISLFFCMR